MRSNKVKEIRTQWNNSRFVLFDLVVQFVMACVRFFLGKNKVMRIALGRDDGDECVILITFVAYICSSLLSHC